MHFVVIDFNFSVWRREFCRFTILINCVLRALSNSWSILKLTSRLFHCQPALYFLQILVRANDDFNPHKFPFSSSVDCYYLRSESTVGSSFISPFDLNSHFTSPQPKCSVSHRQWLAGCGFPRQWMAMISIKRTWINVYLNSFLRSVPAIQSSPVPIGMRMEFRWYSLGKLELFFVKLKNATYSTPSVINLYLTNILFVPRPLFHCTSQLILIHLATIIYCRLLPAK